MVASSSCLTPLPTFIASRSSPLAAAVVKRANDVTVWSCPDVQRGTGRVHDSATILCRSFGPSLQRHRDDGRKRKQQILPHLSSPQTGKVGQNKVLHDSFTNRSDCPL